jgi:hypothetical protein
MAFYKVTTGERFRMAILGPDGEELGALFYRRLPWPERLAIEARNEKRGLPDYYGTLRDVALAALVGWEGYLDPATGEPVPFPVGSLAPFPHGEPADQAAYAEKQAAVAGISCRNWPR